MFVLLSKVYIFAVNKYHFWTGIRKTCEQKLEHCITFLVGVKWPTMPTHDYYRSIIT